MSLCCWDRNARYAEQQVAHSTSPVGVQDTEVDYSNVLTIGGMEVSIGQGADKKSLPAGTKRSNFEGYEVVDVPAMEANKGLPPPDLVQISILEEWARTAFKGYKTLNRIQSRIFEVRQHYLTMLLHKSCFAVNTLCSTGELLDVWHCTTPRW
jgi:hypothetical protein